MPQPVSDYAIDTPTPRYPDTLTPTVRLPTPDSRLPTPDSVIRCRQRVPLGKAASREGNGTAGGTNAGGPVAVGRGGFCGSHLVRPLDPPPWGSRVPARDLARARHRRFAGSAAEEVLATDKKGKGKGKSRTPKGHGSGADRVAAERKGKGRDKGKKKGKGKAQGAKANGNGGGGCAGTPLQPGQDFLDCDLSGEDLVDGDLHSSSFKSVNLFKAALCGIDLHSTSFSESDLGLTNLTGANLDSSTFSKTSFGGANLEGASFKQSTFSKCDLSGANLTRANLLGATLDDVNLDSAIFCETVLPDGSVDNSDCDSCDNTCGCHGCYYGHCEDPDCCSGECVNTQTDPDNCGACGIVCATSLNPASTNECIDGECTPVAKEDGTACEDERGRRESAAPTARAQPARSTRSVVPTRSATPAIRAAKDSASTSTPISSIAARATPRARRSAPIPASRASAAAPAARSAPVKPRLLEVCQDGYCYCGFGLIDCDHTGNCSECCNSSQCFNGKVCVDGACICEGIVCDDVCVEGNCCQEVDCPARECFAFEGCVSHVCDYDVLPDGSSCDGGAGTCTDGSCIPNGGS